MRSGGYYLLYSVVSHFYACIYSVQDIYTKHLPSCSYTATITIYLTTDPRCDCTADKLNSLTVDQIVKIVPHLRNGVLWWICLKQYYSIIEL